MDRTNKITETSPIDHSLNDSLTYFIQSCFLFRGESILTALSHCMAELIDHWYSLVGLLYFYTHCIFMVL